MKRKKFSREQVAEIMAEAEKGVEPSELAERYGFSNSAFQNWKRRLKQKDKPSPDLVSVIVIENRRLRSAVARLVLEVESLRETAAG